MKTKIKRLTVLACRNMVALVAVVFVAAATIVGAIYVLGAVFGPTGMTVLLPMSLMAIVAVIIAIHQIKREELEKKREERRKHAVKHLATQPNTVSSVMKPESKAVSK